MLIGFLAVLGSGCKDHCYDGEQNQDEEGKDCGGSCIPCDTTTNDTTALETCFDGIMNQDETGVDCGGICLPCPNDTIPPDSMQLCEGNGSMDILPLAVGNFWSYDHGGIPMTIRVTSSAQLMGQIYYRLESTGPYPYDVEYVRSENGNLYRLEADVAGNPAGTEYLYLDSAAVVGTGWGVNGVTVDSLAFLSGGDTLNSANGCAYANVSTFQDLFSGTGQIQRSYQPGIGVVYCSFSGGLNTAYLDSVSLH